ncbi:hypothetical protein NFHSH190041_15560 [Shewanella sp. NFH-SH190041]|uniref:ATP-dependent zinc protease family protein n=1 Tax=Shewanella sp. NFH-SH190041 TaxID=2950245 RepID=UPI0021C274C2|nr:ATP-dependent zinc protease [Shewanella sp. NFH-SH190041]BDM64104.1 hypothetical protein NFHSH190041_15560 [Shewanella sp. NFH-SH190041]
MLKQTFSLALVASLLSGCAMTAKQPKGPIPVDAETLNQSLSQNTAQLKSELDKVDAQQSKTLAALQGQVSALQLAIDGLKQPEETKIVEVPAKCPETLGDKFLLGQVEYIYVDELKASFNTRIDTGAESSSLDARNIVLFERDGNQWVRFDVHTHGDKAPAQTFESRVERFVRIKQDADTQDDRRPVIRAHLKIGRYAAETDLNLTDRRHLEYPLLLGRKFMKDIAVVDVGQSYIHGKPQPDTIKHETKEK